MRTYGAALQATPQNRNYQRAQTMPGAPEKGDFVAISYLPVLMN